MTRINIELPDELHKEAKLNSLLHNKTLIEYIREAIAEKIITLGKKSGLHSYRQTLSYVTDKRVTEKVFADLAKRYSERPGGYTRIVKLEPRLGDGALMAKIELVE